MSVERIHAKAAVVVEGRLFEPKSTRFCSVSVHINERDQVELQDLHTSQRQTIEILEFPNRVAGVPETLLVRFVDDEPGVARRLEFLAPLQTSVRFPGEHRGWNWLSVVEQKPLAFAIPLIALMVSAFFLYRAVLDVTVDVVVDRIPSSIEGAMSNQALGSMRLDDTFMTPTKVYVKEQLIMSNAVERYAGQLGIPAPSIEVYRSTLGANAFAFPAGPIVVTEELLLLNPSEDALRGLVAHEIAHIYERHSLRQVVRVLGLLTIVTFAFGGDAMTIDDFQLLYYPFVTTAFSRADEREADSIARALLIEAGHDPDGLIDMLRLIEESCQEHCWEFGLLSTHPSFADRLEHHKHN